MSDSVVEPPRRRRFLEIGSPLYQLSLVALSVYVLGALVVESLFITDPEVRTVLQYVDLVICFVFLGDFFLNFYMSGFAYLKTWGWIDFISSIPMIAPLRWGVYREWSAC